MTKLLIRLCVKNSDDIKDTKVRNAYGTLAGAVGIVCNLILSLIKIFAGLLSGSISIIADGFNNLSDMGSSVITMIGFKLASKPADRDHPYGHGRMEYMSALIVAALIILVGVELIRESFSALTDGAKSPAFSPIALAILIFSVIIKLWLFFFNRYLSRKINSSSLKATAQDCINDCISTSAVLISVIIAKLVILPFNLDAVIGLCVAVFIIFSGVSAAKETIGSLLGEPPEPELIENIKNTVLSFEGFIGIHDLIVHNYGPGRQFASVHVEVPHNIDIVACHERIDTCEKLVNERLGIELVIHMDPVETDNKEINNTKAVIQDVLKGIDKHLSLHDFRMTPKGKNRTNFIFDVVLPSDIEMSQSEICEQVDTAVKAINKGYYCVINFDNDYTGY